LSLTGAWSTPVKCLAAVLPGAPTFAAQTAFAGDFVTLAWAEGTGNGSNIVRYTVYSNADKGTDGTAFTTLVGATKGPALSYKHTAAAGTFFYKITATNAVGMGVQSTVAFKSLIIAPPSVPVVPNPTVVSATKVDLAWTASTGTGVTDYTVQISNNALATTPTWKNAGGSTGLTGAGKSVFSDATLMARDA